MKITRVLHIAPNRFKGSEKLRYALKKLRSYLEYSHYETLPMVNNQDKKK